MLLLGLCGTIRVMIICKKCKEEKPKNSFWEDKRYKSGFFPWCKSCHKKNNNLSHKKSYKDDPEKFKERARLWRSLNNDKVRASVRKLQERVKLDSYYAYGGKEPKCNCCGEKDMQFLTIDHINNDGASHRKKYNLPGNSIHFWLKKNNYPEGFQLLCFNCNLGKYRAGGICPHKINL